MWFCVAARVVVRWGLDSRGAFRRSLGCFGSGSCARLDSFLFQDPWRLVFSQAWQLGGLAGWAGSWYGGPEGVSLQLEGRLRGCPGTGHDKQAPVMGGTSGQLDRALYLKNSPNSETVTWGANQHAQPIRRRGRVGSRPLRRYPRSMPGGQAATPGRIYGVCIPHGRLGVSSSLMRERGYEWGGIAGVAWMDGV